MTSYVTIKMIAEHVGITVAAMRKALHRAGVECEKVGRNLHIKQRVANTFLARHYPEAVARNGAISLTPGGLQQR